jgi:hypothetical protein
MIDPSNNFTCKFCGGLHTINEWKIHQCSADNIEYILCTNYTSISDYSVDTTAVDKSVDINAINDDNFDHHYNNFIIHHNNEKFFVHTKHVFSFAKKEIVYYRYYLDSNNDRYFVEPKNIEHLHINMLDIINSSSTLLEVRDTLNTLILFS